MPILITLRTHPCLRNCKKRLVQNRSVGFCGGGYSGLCLFVLPCHLNATFQGKWRNSWEIGTPTWYSPISCYLAWVPRHVREAFRFLMNYTLLIRARTDVGCSAAGCQLQSIWKLSNTTEILSCLSGHFYGKQDEVLAPSFSYSWL